jgi:hypothetical protein
MRIAFLLALIFLLGLGVSCTPAGPQQSQMDKIKFDLDKINEDGLQGPPDGLRSLAYEFCIPEAKKAEVGRIDPTVQFSRSPGRIGCGEGELLCIGETHQANYREVLAKLTALDYVREIREAHFE